MGHRPAMSHSNGCIGPQKSRDAWPNAPARRPTSPGGPPRWTPGQSDRGVWQTRFQTSDCRFQIGQEPAVVVRSTGRAARGESVGEALQAAIIRRRRLLPAVAAPRAFACSRPAARRSPSDGSSESTIHERHFPHPAESVNVARRKAGGSSHQAARVAWPGSATGQRQVGPHGSRPGANSDRVDSTAEPNSQPRAMDSPPAGDSCRNGRGRIVGWPELGMPLGLPPRQNAPLPQRRNGQPVEIGPVCRQCNHPRHERQCGVTLRRLPGGPVDRRSTGEPSSSRPSATLLVPSCVE